MPAASKRPLNILISGGAGFIGSHLADLLLARGDVVTVIDDLSTGRRDNLPERHERLRFIEADLADTLRILGPGEKFDQIYHLAAAVGVQLVMEDPVHTIETNVDGTSAVLHFARSRTRPDCPHGIPTLVASTSEVYGKGVKVPFAEDDDVVYGPTTKARWSYAYSKAIDEHLVLAYHHQHKFPGVVARFFNTVGPRQIGTYGMVIPRFVESAMAGRDIEVYGDGKQSRCFCHVSDVANILPKLVETPACHGRVFNVGTDQSISIIDLANLVIKVTGSKSKVRARAYDDVYPQGFEDLRERRPDLSRIAAAVGFRPTIPLEQTIRDTMVTLKQQASNDAASGAAGDAGGGSGRS